MESGIRGKNHWNRLGRRAVRHHFPLMLFSSVSVALVYWLVKSPDFLFRLSMATAYPGLALLVVTLVLGPLKVIRHKRNPLSSDFTRDTGIWAAIVSLVHVVSGLQVHMRGQMWLLFLDKHQQFPYFRLDMFGAANDTGLVATFVLLILVGASNDWVLGKMGAKKWKQLQRSNYILFVFVVLHGILYMLVTKRSLPFVLLFSWLVVIAVWLQVWGIRHRIRKAGINTA